MDKYRKSVIEYLNNSLYRKYGVVIKDDFVIMKFVLDLKLNLKYEVEYLIRLAKTTPINKFYKYLDICYNILIKHFDIKVYLDDKNFVKKYV